MPHRHQSLPFDNVQIVMYFVLHHKIQRFFFTTAAKPQQVPVPGLPAAWKGGAPPVSVITDIWMTPTLQGDLTNIQYNEARYYKMKLNFCDMHLDLQSLSNQGTH